MISLTCSKQTSWSNLVWVIRRREQDLALLRGFCTPFLHENTRFHFLHIKFLHRQWTENVTTNRESWQPLPSQTHDTSTFWSRDFIAVLSCWSNMFAFEYYHTTQRRKISRIVCELQTWRRAPNFFPCLPLSPVLLLCAQARKSFLSEKNKSDEETFKIKYIWLSHVNEVWVGMWELRIRNL